MPLICVCLLFKLNYMSLDFLFSNLFFLNLFFFSLVTIFFLLTLISDNSKTYFLFLVLFIFTILLCFFCNHFLFFARECYALTNAVGTFNIAAVYYFRVVFVCTTKGFIELDPSCLEPTAVVFNFFVQYMIFFLVETDPNFISFSYSECLTNPEVYSLVYEHAYNVALDIYKGILTSEEFTSFVKTVPPKTSDSLVEDLNAFANYKGFYRSFLCSYVHFVTFDDFIRYLRYLLD